MTPLPSNPPEAFLHLPDLQMFLDFSLSGLSTDHFHQLSSLFQKAMDDMKALEAGAISNPDEHRQVGHYWLRNSDIAPDNRIKADIDDALIQVKHFAQAVLDGGIVPPNGQRFSTLLLVGIGGSALGPQLVDDALSASSGLRTFFLDNTDPDGI